MIVVDAHDRTHGFATPLDLVVLGGSLGELTTRLRDAGTRVRSLTVRPAGERRLDLSDIDFAAATPRLRTLRVSRAKVNASVFSHPTLTRLALSAVDYSGPPEIRLANTLEWVRIESSSLPAASFTVGAASALHTFRCDQTEEQEHDRDQEPWQETRFGPELTLVTMDATTPFRRPEGPRLLRLVASN